MARSKSKNKSSSDTLVSYQRKREILGLILMALGVLFALALLTYDPADAVVAADISWQRALNPNNTQTNNALGLIGAALSELMIPHFFGYPILLVAGLLVVWGYRTFRNRVFGQLPWISILVVTAMMLITCFAGWFGLVLERDVLLWAGMWGVGMAGWFYNVFGAVGSLLIFFVLAAINLLLLFDHDIQRSLDRAEETVQSLGSRLRDKWSGWKENRKKRKEERQEKRARKKEARKKKKEKESSAAASEDASPTPTPDSHTTEPTTASNKRQVTVNQLYSERDKTVAKDSDTPPQETQPPAGPPSDVQEDGGPQLHVRRQVQEETANLDERTSKKPDKEINYTFPSVSLLEEGTNDDPDIDLNELERNKQILLEKLETYNVDITDIGAVVGPTVTLYELTPASGVRVSRVTALEDDLAMALAAEGIRMIAPIPGKSAIGVEIPNRNRELVRIHSVLNTSRFRDADMELPIALGKSVEGEVFVEDLARMPHLLIAGATGSGKSVGINALITGLLYACHPKNLKFVLVDPKKIELQQYENLYKHYMATPEDAENPIITDFEQAIGTLKSCEKEMENRYDLLSEAGVRGIIDYNKKFQQGRLNPEHGHRHLPYIVVIIDELADLMMTSGKDVEGPIARLAQMARAVGIHLILATQRPSVDVITGLIKANFPSRIAYQVASNVDSRTILDQKGAEQLVGNGDLLYMNGSRIIRLQGPFISVDEVEKVTTFIGRQKGYDCYQLPPIDENAGGLGDTLLPDTETDELFEKAARIIVRHQQGSVSLLQRKMSVGYTRAARIVDQLEEANIVGPFQGSKARDVYVESEERLDELLSDDSEEE